jgi:predicted 3-demethylubiquinone-9 3-methyltransferase (glyoxalase superfamily)
MQKIVPHLWFDKEAKAAAEFYVSIFDNSKITQSTVLHDTPSGDAETVSFTLAGYEFMAISAGPFFKLNPSISLMVNFDPSQDAQAQEHLDKTWQALAEGGKVLMPLQEYSFSKHYGWVEDKYGVSWQLILTNPNGEQRPFIVPTLMFTKEGTGKAEEATDFYMSIFNNAKRGILAHYPEGGAPDPVSKVMYTDFQLVGQWFAAMDGGTAHEFQFSEALSLMVKCETQEEIDRYWEQLSAVPEAEQCGWLKDRYGVSWQIIPTAMGEMMGKGTPEQKQRLTQAFLGMKKFDISALEAAYRG